jgi:hypothetical protein
MKTNALPAALAIALATTALGIPAMPPPPLPYSTEARVFHVGKVGKPGAAAWETRAGLVDLHGSLPAPLSREEFVARVKAGQSFKVTRIEPEACQPCFGRGILTGLRGGGLCPACHGSGACRVTYTLCW